MREAERTAVGGGEAPRTFGTTSARSVISMRPAGAPPMVISCEGGQSADADTTRRHLCVARRGRGGGAGGCCRRVARPQAVRRDGVLAVWGARAHEKDDGVRHDDEGRKCEPRCALWGQRPRGRHGMGWGREPTVVCERVRVFVVVVCVAELCRFLPSVGHAAEARTPPGIPGTLCWTRPNQVRTNHACQENLLSRACPSFHSHSQSFLPGWRV